MPAFQTLEQSCYMTNLLGIGNHRLRPGPSLFPISCTVLLRLRLGLADCSFKFGNLDVRGNRVGATR